MIVFDFFFTDVDSFFTAGLVLGAGFDFFTNCDFFFAMDFESARIFFTDVDSFFTAGLVLGAGFDFFTNCGFFFAMGFESADEVLAGFDFFAGVDFLFFPVILFTSFFASSKSFLNLIISSITSIINTAFLSRSAHTFARICVIIYRSLILCKTFLLHGWN